MEEVFIEITRLNAGHGIDHWPVGGLGMALFNFGNIEGRQRGIEVKMEALRIAGLALRQAGKLLGISKNGLDLKTRFIVMIEHHRIQFHIGRKQQRIARLVGIR